MAHTHALTFFVAKGMIDAGTGLDVPFAPASFKALARTIEVVRSDAGHLFAAIQRENPYASEARGQLLKALGEIHQELERLPAEVGSPEVESMAMGTPEARSPEVTESRAHLDQIDRELLALLARRNQLARRAARAEATQGQEQGGGSAHEQSLLAARRAWASELGLEEAEVEFFFRTLSLFSAGQGRR
jgi:prephenate dehydrogenase